MHLPSKRCLSRSLLPSVSCFSLTISLMPSLHMCSRRTKLLISHPRCSKPSAQKRRGAVCVYWCVRASIPVFKLPFWLQTASVGTKNPTEKFEVWNGLLCSAAVDANTHLNTCSGNAIKGRDVCEAQQPRAQNWFTELEKSRSRDVEESRERKQVRFRAHQTHRKTASEKTIAFKSAINNVPSGEFSHR